MPSINKSKARMRDPYLRPIKPSKNPKDREPFITGSYAYGEPTKESDVDLVVFMNEATRNFLREYIDENENPGISGKPPNYALRFGGLNIICCIHEAQYEAWKRGTLALIEERPVKRDRAIEVLSKIREELNVEDMIDAADSE